MSSEKAIVEGPSASEGEDSLCLEDLETLKDSGAAALTPSQEENLRISEDESDYFDRGDDAMQEDFHGITGLEERWTSEFGPTLFAARKPEDIPCKFHDGVSGTCWKGPSCVYHHKPNTGGLFAKKHPEVAFATSHQAPITSTNLLPVKPRFSNMSEIVCTVTHVDSPSEFYVMPRYSDPEEFCICAHMEKLMDSIKSKINNPKKQKEELKKMEKAKEEKKYFKDPEKEDFGYNYDPPGHFLSGFDVDFIDTDASMKSPLNATYLKIINEELDKLGHCHYYKKLQRTRYHPGIELVAVRKENKWWRATVLSDFEGGRDDKVDPENYYVQLLDTGEKLIASKVDICQLPHKLSRIGVCVFKCALYGISPLFGTWTKESIALFKELAMKKELSAVVEIVPEECGEGEELQLFEGTPYQVKLFISEKDKEVNVTRELVQAGCGLEWDLFSCENVIDENETDESETDESETDGNETDHEENLVEENKEPTESSGTGSSDLCEVVKDSKTL